MISISRAEFWQVNIPFRFQYGHSLKRHKGVSMVICVLIDELGQKGYGESIPRSYVSGENVDSVLLDSVDIINQIGSSPYSLDSFKQDLLSLVKTKEGQAIPSCAFAGIDIAFADLWAKKNGKTVTEVLSASSEKVATYTASIGLANRSILWSQLLLYKSMGFKHFKLKVGDEFDCDRLRLIRKLFGNDASVFVDANACWNASDALKKAEMFEGFGVWAMEEPLRNLEPKIQTETTQFDRESLLNDDWFEAYARFRSQSSLPVIADESLISLSSLDKGIQSDAFDIYNIRLSKCGGFSIASEMVERVKQTGCGFSLCAMVGESPILANAGFHFRLSNPDCRYAQGFSHKLLHGAKFATSKERITRGNRIHLKTDIGLGANIDFKQLEVLATRKETVAL